jgi:hypothetical protein
MDRLTVTVPPLSDSQNPKVAMSKAANGTNVFRFIVD